MNSGPQPGGAHALGVASLSLVASALGFVTQLVVAAVFGAGQVLDTYFVVASVPTLLATILAGVFSYALVPALVAERGTRGEACPVLAPWVVSRVTQASAALVVLGVAGTFLLQADGSRDDVLRAVALPVWLGAAATVLAGATGAVAVAEGQVLQPQLAVLATYLGTLGGAIAGTRAGIAAIAWGTCLGTLVGAGATAWTTRAAWRHRVTSCGPAVALLPGASVALVMTLAYASFALLDAWLLPVTGEGAVALAGFAQRLLVAGGTILAAGPAVVLQPRLAAARAAGHHGLAADELARAVRLVVVVTVPVLAIGAVVGQDAVALLFQRGKFDARDTARLAAALPWYLVGLVPMLVGVVLGKAVFAFGDLGSAILLGTVTPTVYALVLTTLRAELGLAAAGVAYAVAWGTSVALVLRRTMRGAQVASASALAVVSGAGLAAGAVSALTATMLRTVRDLPAPATHLLVLVVGGVAGLATYATIVARHPVTTDARALARRLMPRTNSGQHAP